MVTDADCELPERWIESMVGYFVQNNLKMLLGPVLLSPANSLFEKLQVLEHLSLIASTAGSAAIGMPVMCNGANMMYDRQAALDVEKYRTDMKIASGDDMFLMEQFIMQLEILRDGAFVKIDDTGAAPFDLDPDIQEELRHYDGQDGPVQIPLPHVRHERTVQS